MHLRERGGSEQMLLHDRGINKMTRVDQAVLARTRSVSFVCEQSASQHALLFQPCPSNKLVLPKRQHGVDWHDLLSAAQEAIIILNAQSCSTLLQIGETERCKQCFLLVALCPTDGGGARHSVTAPLPSFSVFPLPVQIQASFKRGASGYCTSAHSSHLQCHQFLASFCVARNRTSATRRMRACILRLSSASSSVAEPLG